MPAGLDDLVLHGGHVDTLVAVYCTNLPDVPVHCVDAQTSGFARRDYAGIIAIGSVLTLNESLPKFLLRMCTFYLRSPAQMLFTVPPQEAVYEDVLTGRTSRSLGEMGYRDVLVATDVARNVVATDEGDNPYFGMRYR